MARAGEAVEILLPIALDRTYTYRVPFHLELEPGDVVMAPLGGREHMGVVWEGTGLKAASNKLRFVSEKLDAPSLTAAMRRFVDWVANWTLTPRGMVMRSAARVADAPADRPRLGYRRAGAAPERLTPQRRRVIAAFEERSLIDRKGLVEIAGVSAAVIDALVDEGTLGVEALPPLPVAPVPDPDHASPALEPAQKEAATTLTQAVAARNFSTILLDGVTGSGKTAVYFEAIAEAVRRGGQALVLLPEIALTSALVERFEERFGVRPAEWHSGIAAPKRARLWRAVAEGKAAVVIGARSALFLPFPDLRLIVVDEEHDAAFKQEDGFRYNARDMAVVRARLSDAVAVMASATPSLESRVNADNGRYRRLVLPDRTGGREMPHIETIDLRREGPPRGRWLAPRLVEAVRETVAAGDQALLFLNRRGYAPLTLCHSCGHRFQCPNCTAWLVEHRYRKALVCHHCGHAEPVPRACPSCQKVDSLVAVGPGVERIAEEAATLFPDNHIVTLSSDIAGGTDRLREEIDAVMKGAAEIIIGTQLIAKGHTFPKLTTVGVVDADLGLSTGDPRAAERTFQLIGQVTGRAGRGDKPGRAFLQTHDPNHPVMRALVANDSEAFYRHEIAERRAATLPPFGRMAILTVSDPDRATADAYARALSRVKPPAPAARLLGPAEAPIAVLRGRHRFRLLVQAPRDFGLQEHLRAWLAVAPKAKGSTSIDVDIDPMSFL